MFILIGTSSFDCVYVLLSLLLAAVTAEDAQDRSDRAILTPWVKFLWESYRQCLDLLRNNNRVEQLYHDIAKQAFEFCLQYTRKTEFRKLCDNVSVIGFWVNKFLQLGKDLPLVG